jgi:hypothetical protein
MNLKQKIKSKMKWKSIFIIYIKIRKNETKKIFP